MLGAILAGSFPFKKYNFNTALIGAASVILIGAGILLFGIQFKENTTDHHKKRMYLKSRGEIYAKE